LDEFVSKSTDLGTTLTAKEGKCCGELWTNFGLLTVSGAATSARRRNRPTISLHFIHSTDKPNLPLLLARFDENFNKIV
jgi:hypothetical protein